jgi:Uma2 family endonuclease
MAAQPTSLSLEEFHRLYDGAKPSYEFWYGAAVQKPMPTTLHGLVQLLIMVMPTNTGWMVAPEVRLKVVREAELVPDVIAIHGKFKGRYPTSGPELCVEIMSPDDRLSNAIEKAKICRSWGSQFVWIIDPQKRTAWTLSQDSTEPLWILPTGTLRAGDTAIELQEPFAEVDNELEDAEERE